MEQLLHKKWTVEEDTMLINYFRNHIDIQEIAVTLARSVLAVRSRLAKLNFLPPEMKTKIENLAGLQPNIMDSNNTSGITQSEISDTINKIFTKSDSSPQSFDVKNAFLNYFFVYALVNKSGQVYVGYSKDVWNRINQHNSNVGAVATKDAGPWFPFAVYCYASEADARDMEIYIHRNFAEFKRRTEKSICEVLSIEMGYQIKPWLLTLL